MESGPTAVKVEVGDDGSGGKWESSEGVFEASTAVGEVAASDGIVEAALFVVDVPVSGCGCGG